MASWITLAEMPSYQERGSNAFLKNMSSKIPQTNTPIHISFCEMDAIHRRVSVETPNILVIRKPIECRQTVPMEYILTELVYL